jgi:D-xylose transport system substrate-binding protein
VTGQDGDLAAINRVALGTQLVSVWKNSVDLGTVAANAAIALADGADPASIEGVMKFSGGAKGVEMNSILLAPTPITKDNIQVAIDAGHITKEQACAGVAAGSVPAC